MRLILILFVFLTFKSFAQENNPLPPGPSNINGQVVDSKNKAIANAEITVLYTDKQQRPCDTFKSNMDGYFTAYVFRYDQSHIDLEIKINGKICQTIRIDHPGMGFVIMVPGNKIICQ